MEQRARANTSVHTVLCAIFIVPLAFGIYLATGTNRRSAYANQVSHDLASMYAQGVDFSQLGNQRIAMRLLDGRDRESVLILTKIQVVTAADCGTASGGDCANSGYPVIVQRIVIGDAGLHSSTLGSPPGIDHAGGAVSSWATDASARVTDSTVSLRPGEFAYAAEAFVAGPDDRTGVYARTLL